MPNICTYRISLRIPLELHAFTCSCRRHRELSYRILVIHSFTFYNLAIIFVVTLSCIFVSFYVRVIVRVQLFRVIDTRQYFH